MEAAAAAVNFQYKTPNSPKLTPNSPEIKPHFLNFASCTALIPRNTTARCSTRPTANNQSPADGKNHASSPNSSPNSKIQSQGNPNLGQSISSNSSYNITTGLGLVFDLGPENSWDGLEIGSPVVKRYLGDDEERWYMWYHGRSVDNPESNSIGLAVSSNGIHWERAGGEGVPRNASAGLVLNKSSDWWAFDTHGVRPCEVVIMSSNKVRLNSAIYWLYYTGFYLEEIENLEDNNSNGKVIKSLPGLAMSQDGRNWARIEGEHHTGALFDAGSNGDWDSSFISSPQVVYHGSGDLRLYYHSFDATSGGFAIGLARSRDGMRWVKLGKILGPGGNGEFDQRGTVNPRVVRKRKDGSYLMAFEGVGGDGKRGIGMAVSTDGLKGWRRVREGAVLEPAREGSWDCEGVGMPCLVEMDEMVEWRMYYGGIGKGGRRGIGLAVCQGSGDWRFHRWSGFHF